MSTATVAPDALSAQSAEVLTQRMDTCRPLLAEALTMEDLAQRAEAAMRNPQPVPGELPEETAARHASEADHAADNAHETAAKAHHAGGSLLIDIDCYFHGGYPASNDVIATETGLAAEARTLADQCRGLHYTPWDHPGYGLYTIAQQAFQAAEKARTAHDAAEAGVYPEDMHVARHRADWLMIPAKLAQREAEQLEGMADGDERTALQAKFNRARGVATGHAEIALDNAIMEAVEVKRARVTISGRLLQALDACTGDKGRHRLDTIRADGHTLTAADGGHVVQITTPCDWGAPALYGMPKLRVIDYTLRQTSEGPALSDGKTSTILEPVDVAEYPEVDECFFEPSEDDITITLDPEYIINVIAALMHTRGKKGKLGRPVTITIPREDIGRKPVMFSIAPERTADGHAARALIAPIRADDDDAPTTERTI